MPCFYDGYRHVLVVEDTLNLANRDYSREEHKRAYSDSFRTFESLSNRQQYARQHCHSQGSSMDIPGELEPNFGNMGDSRTLVECNAPTSTLQQPLDHSTHVGKGIPASSVNKYINDKALANGNVTHTSVSAEICDNTAHLASPFDLPVEGFVKPVKVFPESISIPIDTTSDHISEGDPIDATISPRSTTTERPEGLSQPRGKLDATHVEGTKASIEAQLLEAMKDTIPVSISPPNKSLPIAQVDQPIEQTTGASLGSHQSDSNHDAEDSWEMIKKMGDPDIIMDHESPSAPSKTGPGPGSGPGPSKQTNQSHTSMATIRNRNPAPREKDWENIKKLRTEVWSLRSNIHEMRSVLRQKQLAKSTADDNFFQFVRRQAAKDNAFRTLDEENTLAALLGNCEIARNEYGPLEDDLNLLESDLGNQEYALQKLERKLYDTPINMPVPQLEEINAVPTQLFNSSESSDSEISQYFHPLVTDYLSKMGDVDIFRERLDWHLDEKETLDEEQEKRQKVGLDIAPTDQEWLDKYSTVENELQAQLKQAEEEAEKLRVECFSRGLIDEDGNPTDFEDRERQTFLTENVDSNNETSEYVKFPTLIPPPNGKQIALGESRLDGEPDMDRGSSVSPRYRVDQWMLHQLRMSVLGVHLLADTFEIQNGSTFKDGGRWQKDVLAKWFVDSGDEWNIGPQTYSSGHSTPGPQANDPPTLISQVDDDTLGRYHDESRISLSNNSSILRHAMSIPLPEETGALVANRWSDLILHGSRHSV